MATTAQILRCGHGGLDDDHRDEDAGDRFQRRARGACAADPELSHDAGRALFIKSLPRLASYRSPAVAPRVNNRLSCIAELILILLRVSVQFNVSGSGAKQILKVTKRLGSVEL